MSRVIEKDGASCGKIMLRKEKRRSRSSALKRFAIFELAEIVDIQKSAIPESDICRCYVYDNPGACRLSRTKVRLRRMEDVLNRVFAMPGLAPGNSGPGGNRKPIPGNKNLSESLKFCDAYDILYKRKQSELTLYKNITQKRSGKYEKGQDLHCIHRRHRL